MSLMVNVRDILKKRCKTSEQTKTAKNKNSTLQHGYHCTEMYFLIKGEVIHCSVNVMCNFPNLIYFTIQSGHK